MPRSRRLAQVVRFGVGSGYRTDARPKDLTARRSSDSVVVPIRCPEGYGLSRGGRNSPLDLRTSPDQILMGRPAWLIFHRGQSTGSL